MPNPSGAGTKILMFGALCAAAVGTFMYVKKNNINVEEVVKKIADRI